MHHTIFLCFALLIPLVFLGGCAPSASDAYHKITPQAGYEMMKKEPVTLIDVREPAEYQQGQPWIPPAAALGALPLRVADGFGQGRSAGTVHAAMVAQPMPCPTGKPQ